MRPDPKPKPNDDIYIEVLRKMTPEQRLIRAFELSKFTKELFREGLRAFFRKSRNRDSRLIFRKNTTMLQSRLLEKVVDFLSQNRTEYMVTKRLYLFSIILLWFANTHAQTKIPDANFAAAIRKVCPTCIDANNTLLPPAATLTSLNVRKSGISDLTGIAGFSSLQTITCDSNQLSTLPTLPNSLLTLNCFSNQIINLGTLPIKLLTLNCNTNQITVLPDLPSSLLNLYCAINKLTQLPNLPNGLFYLECSNNQLTSLPTLPNNLRSLYCRLNKITVLPTLNNGLSTLDCNGNQLSILPVLPSSLQTLFCYSNRLTALPDLPNGLISLNCSSNLLTTLPPLSTTLQTIDISYNTAVVFPVLPAGLQFLFCRGNKLTKLPDLPTGLIGLYCSSNSLTVLPTLPNTLKHLFFDFNLLTDFPSFPSGLLSLDCAGHKYTKLPDLPQGLTYLSCYANQLTELPNLPNTLQYIYCSANQLQNLPALPSKLQTLFAFNNPLISLPTLPSTLQSLWVMTTQINCLPILPNTLKDLRIDPTKVLCLPNTVSKMLVYKQNTGNNANDIISTPPVCSEVIPTIDAKITTICLGATATLTATACKAGTLKWSNNATGTSISVSPTVATTYIAVCSTACGNSKPSNAVTINLSGVMPTIPDISATQSLICINESVSLTSSNCNGTVKWSNGQTANTVVVNPVSTTTYTATCQNNCGVSSNSKDLVVTIKSIVPKPTITGSIVFCPNSTATLSNSVTGSGYGYQWKRDGQDISTTASLTINAEGTYFVVVSNNGCTNKSDDFVVKKSLISATITGQNSFCIGTNTTLTATAQNTTGTLQYQWKQDGKNVGDGKNTWAVSQAGNYSVEITDANGCKATSSATTVTEKGADIVSIVKPDGPITVYAPNTAALSATLGYEKDPRFKYQWRKDGKDIAGATHYVHYAATSGSYAATISDADCAVTSSEVKVAVLVPTAVSLNATDELLIYPNPTDGLVVVSAHLQKMTNLIVRLVDLQGRIVEIFELSKHINSEHRIDLRGYSSGTYILEVEGKEPMKRIKIVKN